MVVVKIGLDCHLVPASCFARRPQVEVKSSRSQPPRVGFDFKGTERQKNGDTKKIKMKLMDQKLKELSSKRHKKIEA
jgi:hypothetical protein